MAPLLASLALSLAPPCQVVPPSGAAPPVAPAPAVERGDEPAAGPIVSASLPEAALAPGSRTELTLDVRLPGHAPATAPAWIVQLDVPDGVRLLPAPGDRARADAPDAVTDGPAGRLVTALPARVAFVLDAPPAPGATLGIVVVGYPELDGRARFLRRRLELPLVPGAVAAPGDAADTSWSAPGPRLAAGDRAPDLELPRRGGGTVKLSDLRARGSSVVVAACRGSRAASCAAQLDALQAAHAALLAADASALALVQPADAALLPEDLVPGFDVALAPDASTDGGPAAAYAPGAAYLVSADGVVLQVFPLDPRARPSWTAIADEVRAIGERRAAAPPDPRRAFDFWVGAWDVTTPDGRPAGSNVITRIHGGAALHEQWTGAGGGTGSSLNAYDAATGRWRQTWVDGSGTVLMLEGGIVGGRMELSGERPGPAGGTVTHRIVWTPRPDGRVTQVWTMSPDGGASWTTLADLVYTRRE